MTIIYIEGKVGVKEFEEACQRQNPPNNPQKVVFLFPGNRSHHQSGTTLFTIKSGGGLAITAGLLGEKGYPVLSLPTTTMENWSTNPQQQEIIKGAIADLYRAIGAGYSLMLPIRAHKDTKYFDNGLKKEDGTFEPSFWGGIQASSNKPLANHYITTLDNLADFITLPDEEKQRIAKLEPTNPYYLAYLNGLQMMDDDQWLKPIVRKPQSVTQIRSNPSIIVQQPAAERPKIMTKLLISLPIPDSYKRLYRQDQKPLNGARELLNDYTKSNSTCLRFFYGHWNRHHVKEVALIVKKIDEKILTSTEQVMSELLKITLVNPRGSLARRIQFLSQKFDAEQQDNAANISGIKP